MFEIDSWSKERVYTVMRELLFSLNHIWFLMEEWIKRNCPEKMDGEDFQKLAEEFGAYQAKRLEKILEDTGAGVDRLEQFVKHSHWCAFEDIELTKVSDKKLRMRTLSCTSQKAAKKWGLDYYACGKGSSLRVRQGFFGHIDPKAKVIQVFAPPDSKPAGSPAEVSCEWIISIE